MTRTRFTHWVVLVCIGTLAACTSDQEGPAGNTELNVIIDNGTGNGSSGVVEIDVKSVEYTIVCSGGQQGPGFLDDGDTFPDAVTLNGNLEVVDGRTSGTPPVPTEVWQGFMDIPPGECLVQLRARDADGEVICSGDNVLADLADRTVDANEFQKVDILLVCDVSFQAPVGNLDVDGTFSFVVGNFCPDLFVLNCLDTNLGLPTVPVEGQTSCEVRFRDGDNGCGEGCDPQVCVENGTTGLLDCFPASPPEDQNGTSMAGVSVRTIVTCDSPGLDCDGLGGPDDTECVFDGDQLGTLAVNDGIVPNPASFGVNCGGAAFGATITCTAYTTDGDRDCDKTKVVQVDCPGENFCDLSPGDAGYVDCTDVSANPNPDCVVGSCNRTTQACEVDALDSTPDASGIVCDSAPGGAAGRCQGDSSQPVSATNGVCVDFGCVLDTDCDISSNECITPNAGSCAGGICCGDATNGCDDFAADYTDQTGACDTGQGTCRPGTGGFNECVDNCDDDGSGSPVDCSDTGANAECTADVCTSNTDGSTTCSNPPITCTACCQVTDPNDGDCTAGVCAIPPADCGDHVCTFDSATGSNITLVTGLFALPPLPTSGSVDILCSGSSPDANGKCGCVGQFGDDVAPLVVPTIGDACIIPVPAAACAPPANPLPGDIDCDGGNDQDIDFSVQHDLTDWQATPCTGNVDPPGAGCQTDCATFCGSQGALPAQALCEGYCQLSGAVCDIDADCTDAGDTCVGKEGVTHRGACQCSCLTLGDGTSDGAGDARFFTGFALTILTSTNDRGPDGVPCTADDTPSITLPPQCAPFATTTATTIVVNANPDAGTTPSNIGPLSATGAPFTCNADGVPTTASGAGLVTAASFLDSTLGDLGATIQLNCE